MVFLNVVIAIQVMTLALQDRPGDHVLDGVFAVADHLASPGVKNLEAGGREMEEFLGASGRRRPRKR